MHKSASFFFFIIPVFNFIIFEGPSVIKEIALCKDIFLSFTKLNVRGRSVSSPTEPNSA